MTADRAIPVETVVQMVRTVNPAWTLREATPAGRGHSPTYHVAVETEAGSRTLVLKAAPEDGADGVATEARLLALLDARTSVPVPSVVGAVDDHADLPTPFFVAEQLEGAELQFEETRHLSDDVLRRLARQTGAHLGELHAVDAVDAFGRVGLESEGMDGDRTGGDGDCAGGLDGDSPSADVDQFAVADGTDSWAEALGAMVDRELETLEATRFADLAPELRPWFEARVAGLDGPFEPVLGRIDHGVHNLLVDPDAGDVRAVLDWGFTLAVPAGYDLQCVEYVLSGAVLSTMPGVPDRRALVREALLDGYRSAGGASAVPGGDAHALYELLAVVRATNHLEAGVAKVPEGRESAVAAGLREEIAGTLRTGGRG